MPGKLLRDGTTFAGATNIAVSPGVLGAMLIVTSVPAATGVIVNGVTVAGRGPGNGAVALKTNGSAKRGQGMLPFAVSIARYHPPGASAPRSRPGSCDATS